MIRNIDNIIFDFGGVLVDLDKQRAIKQFAQLGFDASSCIGDYVQGGIFEKLEVGQISPQQFCDEVRTRSAQDEITDEAIVAAWNSMLLGVPSERLDLILELRRTYPIYLLSNTNAIHWKFACETMFSYNGLKAEDYFEKLFISYQMCMMKPNSTIFETVIRLSGVQPERTLFIDDSAANCEAASQLGLKTFCPAEPQEWINLFAE